MMPRSLFFFFWSSYKFPVLTFLCACIGSFGRKKELITISDDSDEEPVTLVPGSPVLVPDDADDDDVSILEVIALLCILNALIIKVPVTLCTKYKCINV